MPKRKKSARQLAENTLKKHFTRTSLPDLVTAFANLMGNANNPAVIARLQYEEIDIGDALPARCLRQGLWLSGSAGVRFALLLSSAGHYGRFT